MSLKENHRSKTIRLIISLTAFALVTSAGLAGVRARRAIWSSKVVVPETVKVLPAPQTQTRRPIADFEAELITVTPYGFEPQEITRPAGRVLLMVDNRSGLAETSLAFSRQAGLRLNEMQVSREDPNWNEVMDLKPGSYVLTESNHPDWECRITITPR